ncbi:MAG: phosphatidate cytidylyltransferase [Chloroflexi bacterium]|nr:phosphatidate cytidylyltransferase [Chloroflexota bacterium]
MIGRLITAAVGIPALALVVWMGGPVFTVVVAAVAAIGAFEVCEMARNRGETPSRVAAVTVTIVLVLSALVLPNSPTTPEYVPLLAASIVLGILAVVLVFGPIQRWRTRGLGITLVAVAYPGTLLAHAPLLRGSEQGLEWVVFLLVVTFSTDTGAFFVGKAIGKRPLAPTISPGKTWEGAIGGFLAAVVAALVAAWALGIEVSVPLIVALGALMGVVGQAGDLFESKLKRLAGVKESGRLLPGHGGVLDRLDSIVFNLALVYYVVAGGVM